MGLGKFIKAKYEKMKQKKLKYKRVDPTQSMRVEARSRIAQKIIAETMKAADSPGKKTLVF